MHDKTIEDEIKIVKELPKIIINGVEYQPEIEFTGKIIHPDGRIEPIKPREV